MWHQDQALLENWLVEGEVTDFEQEHGSCPESHQTCMGNVGAKEASRKVDEPGITCPPCVTGGFKAVSPGILQYGTRFKGRFHVALPLQGIQSFREVGPQRTSRLGYLR